MNAVSLRTLEEVCLEIKNFFVQPQDLHTGLFSITDGKIVPFLPIHTQYFRIVGSRLNDGVHRVDSPNLIDEPAFEGAIWAMCPPRAFLMLIEDIDKWQATNAEVINSPYTSESFGGYSYTKATGGSADGSSSITWQSQFAKRLKPYRRIRLI